MVSLFRQGIGLAEILDVLRSEARRPRKRPIRTWSFWAKIVAERIEDGPRIGSAPVNGATKERVFNLGPEFPHVPESNIPSMIERFVKDGIWLNRAPKPGEPGCPVPDEFLPPHLRSDAANGERPQ